MCSSVAKLLGMMASLVGDLMKVRQKRMPDATSISCKQLTLVTAAVVIRNVCMCVVCDRACR